MTIDFKETKSRLTKYSSAFNSPGKLVEKIGLLELMINELENSATSMKEIKETYRRSLLSKGSID